MVTSSVDKVSTDQLASSGQQASGQILKDDGTVFLHLVYLLKGIVSRDEYCVDSFLKFLLLS
jgi:hypothetical protein